MLLLNRHKEKQTFLLTSVLIATLITGCTDYKLLENKVLGKEISEFFSNNPVDASKFYIWLVFVVSASIYLIVNFANWIIKIFKNRDR